MQPKGPLFRAPQNHSEELALMLFGSCIRGFPKNRGTLFWRVLHSKILAFWGIIRRLSTVEKPRKFLIA